MLRRTSAGRSKWSASYSGTRADHSGLFHLASTRRRGTAAWRQAMAAAGPSTAFTWANTPRWRSALGGVASSVGGGWWWLAAVGGWGLTGP